MNRSARGLTLFAALALLTPTALAQTSAAAQAGASGDDVLYEDPSAMSSANVIQIYPNSNKETTIYTNVRRIRVKGDILIVEWGGTAVTLLPRQFVGAITLNRHMNPANGGATMPASDAGRAPESASPVRNAPVR
ncbi:MAG TPA: hypothetical protein VHQ47_04105 [Phycisphaerae bacterium]|jgi:hypothetical protein|nr:hypothetical protein [Phycisphaerae bacterium]